jgi:hypothetical protein
MKGKIVSIFWGIVLIAVAGLLLARFVNDRVARDAEGNVGAANAIKIAVHLIRGSQREHDGIINIEL